MDNSSSIEYLESHFNPRISVTNFNEYLDTTYNKAQKANKILSGYRDIKYGKGILQTLDIFFENKSHINPIHIFIHGGYWRALDKNYHYHMAIPYNKNKINFCNLNYDLCPNVTLEQICREMVEAIIWIYNNAAKYKCDKNNITISGHSAGAHLVSYLLNIKWKDFNLPEDVIKGAALVSGIYDLEIVKKISVNNDIKLTDNDAIKLSTINKIPLLKLPLIIAYGEKEPDGWKKQSLIYKKNLENNNFKISEILCANDNHFSLIDTLASEKSRICKEMIKLAKGKNLRNISQ